MDENGRFAMKDTNLRAVTVQGLSTSISMLKWIYLGCNSSFINEDTPCAQSISLHTNGTVWN